MSLDDFKKYGQMIADDEGVRAKAKDIGIGDIDGQIVYAKTLGLEFNVQDMEAMANEAGISKDELSEEDLEMIAGGVTTTTAAVVVGAVLGVTTLVLGAVSVASQVATTASKQW